MHLYNGTLDTQDRSSAILGIIELRLDLLELVNEKERSESCVDPVREFLFDGLEDVPCHAFGKLEDDVSGKTVCNDDISSSLRNITGFDVALEIEI